MAWQLIYTSAPRLLEAGRSGFGTVARHRAIHPLLVTVIERDSQFDRSTGGVVFAHRILTAAGSRFHVLTCIRDAGADYTGRTNHIAHHLIIEPREIAALGSAAPTPAEVLAQMNWRPAWSESPRWLDGPDEIPLNRFHRQPGAASAWQTATGDARRAALLQPVRDACLILPPGADALALFAESLGNAPAQSWQATLTTSLQAGDELGDFRWLALTATSPLRANAENGRAVLDLTAPHTLPIPAEPVPVAADAPSAPRSGGNLFLPVPKSLAPAPAKMGSLFDDKLAASGSRPARRSRAALWLGLAALAVALVAGVLFVLPMVSESAEITKQRKDIRDVWTGIFGASSAAELADVPAEKLPIATLILNVAHDTASALRQPKLPPPLSSVEETRKQAQAAGINIPPPIQKTFEIHADFHARDQALTRIEKAAPDAAQFDDLAARHKELLDMGPQPLQQIVAGLKTARLAQIEALWAARFIAILELPPGNRRHEWFRKQFDILPQTAKKTDSARKAGELISDWGKIVTSNGNKETITTLLKERRHLWPAWLVTLANESSGQPKQEIAATGEKPGQKEIPIAVPLNKHFEGELIIALDHTGQAAWAKLKKALGDSKTDLKLMPEAEPANRLFRRGNVFSEGKAGKVCFRLVGETLQPEAGWSPPRGQFVVISDGSPTSTLWLTTKGGTPFRTTTVRDLKREKESIRLSESDAQSVCAAAKQQKFDPQLKWIPKTGVDGSSVPYLFPMESQTEFSLATRLQELNGEIQEMEATIKSLKRVVSGDEQPEQVKKKIADMEQLAKDAGFKKPTENQKADAKERAENERLKNAVPPKPSQSKSLGVFLQLASGGNPTVDKLYGVGTELEKGGFAADSDDFRKCLIRATDVLDEEMRSLKNAAKPQSTRNSNEREQLRVRQDEAKASLVRVKRLNSFIIEVANLPHLRKKAADKVAPVENELAQLNKHPLLAPGKIPDGEFRVVVTVEGVELTLVQFQNP